VKVIFFDVMSTIVHDPFFLEFPAAFGAPLKVLLEGRDRSAWLAFERDEITEAEFHNRFWGEEAGSLGPKMAKVMLDNYRYLDGIESLLEDLQGRARLATLSNYPRWFDKLVDKLGLDQIMDDLFVSYELGVRKPDPEAYLLPTRALSVAPEHCIFVDDRIENCRGAQSVGMTSVLFENADQCRKELDRLLI
jgi:HAD superfamily hydrolase (TIGR01509 family)